MAFAREIFVQIKNKIPFKQSEKEKDSHYAYVGNSIVRISNHCTWMYIWDEILEQNPKDKGKPIISLVFEDEGSTFDERCLLLKRFRKNPIKVQEFVFPIHGNGQYISSEDIKYIIESLFAVQQGGIYKDRTGKCEFFQRISKSPEDSGSVPQQQITNENKQNTNISKNMKKQTIKLNESQLRGLIKESIKAILNENTFESSQWMEIIEKIHGLATELEELANAEDTPMTSGKLDLLKAAQSILKITTTFGGNMGLSSMINEDEFTPHGFYGDSNFGGKEIQISDDGEMARLRTDYGDGPSKPTRWLKIYFNNDGVAYVMFKGRRLRLDQFMRY